MISLKNLLETDDAGSPSKPQAPAPQAPAPQAPSATGENNQNEYSPSFDFNDFQTSLAQTSETAKNNFQNKLLQRVHDKKVTIRASKGQPGQPLKDYTINVSGVSIDYYYDKYVVIFKDEKEKEYFLDPMMKIKILGPVDAPLPSVASSKKQEQPKTVPQEKVTNTVTQGL